jgi:hypothetical protein
VNDLTELLNDAVDDVEPTDRLEAIRARTAAPARAARPWWYAAGGVVLATAATVTVVAVVQGGPSGDGGHHDHDVATDPTVQTVLMPAYFLGDTPMGPRLYREFNQVRANDPLEGALARIQRPASDPDYATAWPHGSFTSAYLGTNDTIKVDLGTADVEGAGAEDLGVQQVVYTLQGTLGRQLPVQFVRDGEPVGAPVDALPQNDVLSLVNISDPAEGMAYSGSIIARGRANSFEATVPWEIQDEDGKQVLSGFATATGTQDRLYPWEVRIDVSDLPFGFYTLVAMTADPSEGEGPDPFTDTRTIIVR